MPSIQNELYIPITEHTNQKRPFCYMEEEDLNIVKQKSVTSVQQPEKGNAQIDQIIKNTERAQNLLTLGKDQMVLDKYAEAILLYSEALEIQIGCSTKIHILHERVLAKYIIGHFQDVIDDCTEILKIMPTNVSALLRRAECYEHLHKYDLCARDYQFALGATQASGNATVQSKLENVVNVIKHELAEKNISIGNEYFNEGNYRLAQQYYSEACQLYPESAIFGEKLYTAMFLLGNLTGALKALKKMAESEIVLDRIISCHLILGEYNGAGKVLTKLKDMAPEWENYDILIEKWSILQNLRDRAVRSFKNKKYKNAVTLIEKALIVLPESISFKMFKAECFMCLDNKEEVNKQEGSWGFSDADNCYIKSLSSFCNDDLLCALSYLDEGLSNQPNHLRCRKVQRIILDKFNADELFKDGQFAEAIKSYTQLLDAKSTFFPRHSFVELMYSRARAKSKLGSICVDIIDNNYGDKNKHLKMLDDAINDCDTILSFDKDNVKVLLLQAECHGNKGNFIESIKAFENLLVNEELKKDTEKSEWLMLKIECLRTASKHNHARKLKKIGDEYFQNCTYEKALGCYDEAISLWQENTSFYKSKIECLILMKDNEAAIKECYRAAAIDGTFLGNYSDMINCLITGDIPGAVRIIQKYQSRDDGFWDKSRLNDLHHLDTLKEAVMASFDGGDFETALANINEVLQITRDCLDLELLKGKCLASLGRLEEASDVALSCMIEQPSNGDAVSLLLSYFNLDTSHVKFLESIIGQSTDLQTAKSMLYLLKESQEKEKAAEELLKSQNYREARMVFTQALEICPVQQGNSNLLLNRALANSKIGLIRDAINDCSRAMEDLNIDVQSYKNGLSLRADCYMEIRKYERAVVDYTELLKMERSQNVKSKLSESKFQLKRFQSDNFYDRLEINRNATDEDINRAFKRLALIHHPDKHSDAPNNEQIEQQELFQKINRAHKVLSNKVQKAAYDRSIKDNTV